VWEAELRPQAVVAACGMLQVGGTSRFDRHPQLPQWVRELIETAAESYLPDPKAPAGTWPLADPLLVLEQGGLPERPLPAFFAPIGDRDPLVDDTLRLQAALARLSVPCAAPIFSGGVHGFHVLMPWQRRSRELWSAQFDFLKEYVPDTWAIDGRSRSDDAELGPGGELRETNPWLTPQRIS
jgi:acetyl esterase